MRSVSNRAEGVEERSRSGELQYVALRMHINILSMQIVEESVRRSGG